jgi:hypothetical protein
MSIKRYSVYECPRYEVNLEPGQTTTLRPYQAARYVMASSAPYCTSSSKMTYFNALQVNGIYIVVLTAVLPILIPGLHLPASGEPTPVITPMPDRRALGSPARSVLLRRSADRYAMVIFPDDMVSRSSQQAS